MSSLEYVPDKSKLFDQLLSEHIGDIIYFLIKIQYNLFKRKYEKWIVKNL